MFRNKDISFDRLHEYGFYYRLLKRGENLTNLPEFLVKYRVHSKAISSYDKENQSYLMQEVVEKFKDIRYNLGLLRKIYFSIKLIFHHLKTMKEKKVSIFGKKK